MCWSAVGIVKQSDGAVRGREPPRARTPRQPRSGGGVPRLVQLLAYDVGESDHPHHRLVRPTGTVLSTRWPTASACCARRETGNCADPHAIRGCMAPAASARVHVPQAPPASPPGRTGRPLDPLISVVRKRSGAHWLGHDRSATGPVTSGAGMFRRDEARSFQGFEQAAMHRRPTCSRSGREMGRQRAGATRPAGPRPAGEFGTLSGVYGKTADRVEQPQR